ncbi:hypothetical protein WYO_3640 [Methylobacterium sp. GXF4]|nr:hypothetical protein WYO_3640 [Methylobacterium sp. GXF4]
MRLVIIVLTLIGLAVLSTAFTDRHPNLWGTSTTGFR